MSDSNIGGSPAPTPEAQAKAHDPARVGREPTAQALQQGRLSIPSQDAGTAGTQQAEAR
jgi:hypothetical protein